MGIRSPDDAHGLMFGGASLASQPEGRSLSLTLFCRRHAPSVQMALGQKTLCNEHCSSEQLKLVRTALPGLSNPVVSRGELSCLEAMIRSGKQSVAPDR